MPLPPVFWHRVPLELARWLLVLIILAVAWPIGMVRAGAQDVFVWAAGQVGVLAAGGWLLCRRKPRVPWFVYSLPVLLLGFGWACLAFPRAYFDPDLLLLIPLPRQVPPWVGGTVDAAATWRKMLLISAYAVLFLVAGDAASSRRWRGRLAGTLALAAGAVAAYGLYQKAAGAPNIYWWPGLPLNSTFFGPFVYHGNAASFLVAGLPFALGLTFLALRQTGGGGRKILWCLVSLTIVTALLVNTSRAGVWLAIAVVVVAGAREGLRHWSGSDPLFRGRLILTGVLAVGGVCLLGVAFGWEKALGRSSVESLTAGFEERSQAPRDALPAAADAGWCGFGPGSFRSVFPGYRDDYDPWVTVTIWRHLHNDPIQTVIEWGWLGAAGWVLLLGLLARHGYKRAAATSAGSGSRVIMEAAGLSFVAVFLHSMVDFPFQIPAIAAVMAVGAGLLASQPETRGSFVEG